MLKIYGGINSSAGRCLWLLEELGVEYERVSLDFKNQEHKEQWYLALNPNGKVPTLVDGEFVLWESCAINQYLAETYQPDLLGTTPKERAHISQWIFWSLLHVQPHIEAIMYQKWFGGKNDQTVIDTATQDVKRYIDVLETYLSDKEYMIGGRFTLADLQVASVINLAVRLEYMLPSTGHIMGWWKRMTERPAMKRAVEKHTPPPTA